MKRDHAQFLLYSILSIIIILSLKDYQIKLIKDFYLFEHDEIGSVNGVVNSVERYDDRDGGRSYKYEVKYLFQGVTYILKENTSPDSIAYIRSGDSIRVKFVLDNPPYATIKEIGRRRLELLVAFIVSIIEITIFVKFCKALKQFWIRKKSS